SATGGCTSGDAGTWTGTRTSVSGSFIGRLSTTDRMPVGVSLTLSQNAAGISGVASFTNSACLPSVQLVGTASGSAFTVHGTAQGSSIELQGVLADDGKSLRVESAMIGGCESESGSGTLAKV